MLGDFEIEVPSSPARSVLPPGGKPIDDIRYLKWKAAWIAETNARLLDRYFLANGHLPDRDPIDWADFDERLFALLGGIRMFEPPTYQHRLRFLAIAMRDDRRRFIRAANHHAAKCAARQEERP